MDFPDPAVPGEVSDLTCPHSNDERLLRISWGEPSDNAHSVIHYTVEVLEYYQPEESKVVETRPLTPPFEQEVQSERTTITSGVGEELLEWVIQHLFRDFCNAE